MNWINTKAKLPEDRTLVVGWWPHEELTGGIGHHHAVEALKYASYQVCYHLNGQWLAFYCGSYDAQLVPPSAWTALLQPGLTR